MTRTTPAFQSGELAATPGAVRTLIPPSLVEMSEFIVGCQNSVLLYSQGCALAFVKYQVARPVRCGKKVCRSHFSTLIQFTGTDKRAVVGFGRI
jgi:hypothetical protein